MIKISSFLCLFMLLSGPRLNVLDLNLFFTSLLAVISPYFFLQRKEISKELYIFLLLIFLFLIASIITSLLSDGLYYASFEHFLSIFLSFLAAYSVVSLYQRAYFNNNYLESITRHIQYSYLINCVFVVLVMISPVVKSMTATYFNQNSKMMAMAEESIRSVDLVMGGGAVASIVFSVFFTLSLSTFLMNKDKLSLVCIVFSLLGMLFTGRTGIVISCVFFIPIILFFNYLNFGNFRFLNVVLFFVKIIISLILILIIIFYISNYFFSETMADVIENSFAWSFEPFLNLINTGKFSSASTDSLLRMYDSGTTFSDVFSFFGTSLTGRNESYYLFTDIGYIRALYTSGFIGLLLIFGKYFYLLSICIIKILNNSIRREEIPLLIAMVFYLIIIFLANFKEYHQTIRSGFPLLMIFSIILLNRSVKVK